MAEDAWFRGPEWDDEAQELFKRKIGRARDKKWFYRRLKALAIAPQHLDDAVALIEECIADSENDGSVYQETLAHDRALKLLKSWDWKARAALMRNFDKSLGGNAGKGMILYEQGKRRQAIKPARRALEQAMAEHGPIPVHPELGKVPALPEEILNRLILAADMWDEDKLGPRPEA